MLYKILGIESAYETLIAESYDKIPRCRQLFVTQSRDLVEAVEENYHKLRALQDAGKCSAKEFFEQSHGKGTRRKLGLFNRDEEAAHQSNLPKKLKDLRDHHYPLFITFDQVRITQCLLDPVFDLYPFSSSFAGWLRLILWSVVA